MTLSRTTALLEAGIEGGLHLGAQVYVSLAGETVADLAVGEAEPGRPMRADDLTLWLSSTKPTAAVGLARLWEAGELGLDDPVARFVPEFAAGGKEGVTLRHVMDWGLGFIVNSAIYDQPKLPYAYGPYASRRTYGHSGYRSSTAFADPEHRLAVALATNGTPADDAHLERMESLCAAVYEDLGLVEG